MLRYRHKGILEKLNQQFLNYRVVKNMNENNLKKIKIIQIKIIKTTGIMLIMIGRKLINKYKNVF